jgi:hypothetical protein
VKLVVPLWVTTRSGQPRLVHFAGHFPRHAMVEWMTEDSVNALLQERGDSE